jgi:hypothetical protein
MTIQKMLISYVKLDHTLYLINYGMHMQEYNRASVEGECVIIEEYMTYK